MGKIVPCTQFEVQIYIKQKLKEYSPKKYMRSTKQKSLASLMTKPRLVQTKQNGIDFMRQICVQVTQQLDSCKEQSHMYSKKIGKLAFQFQVSLTVWMHVATIYRFSTHIFAFRLVWLPGLRDQFILVQCTGHAFLQLAGIKYGLLNIPPGLPCIVHTQIGEPSKSHQLCMISTPSAIQLSATFAF